MSYNLVYVKGSFINERLTTEKKKSVTRLAIIPFQILSSILT